jgi:surface protein
MDFMFADARAFNQNIGSWNVSSVEYMDYMFSDATAFNQNISSWNVSRVEDMINMFNGATAINQSLCAWNGIVDIGGTQVGRMFRNSGCRDEREPTLSNWCHTC